MRAGARAKWRSAASNRAAGWLAGALLLAAALMPASAGAASKQTDHFWHDLLYRNYDYYIPDNVQANAPLLLVFHGILADADRLYTEPEQLPRLAEEHGFVVMWMEAGTWPARSWNAGPCCLPAVAARVDDAGYALEAVRRMSQTVSRAHSGASIDATRIYALGHSNGGSMVHRLALQHPEVFAAIVPISFPLIDNISWQVPAHWLQGRKVPVRAMHAVDDGTIRYEGGWLPFFILDSAPVGRDTWAALNGCTGTMTTAPHPVGTGSTVEAYSDCAQDVSVSLVTFPEGGHRPWFPADNGGVDVMRDAWAFFSQYRKPGHQADRLWAGQSLQRGQYLASSDNRFRLDFGTDGSLVFSNRQSGQVIWNAGVGHLGGDRLQMQDDGNLVLWRPGYWGWKGIFPVYFAPRAVWSSNTAGAGASRVQVNLAGKVQVLRNGVAVWTRG
jgi:poly(3-hydroxybutyrate) depolymerase